MRRNPRKPGRAPRVQGLWRNGRFDAFSTVGGYPIFYMTHNDEVLCPKCASKEEREKPGVVTLADINYESTMYCDACSQQIESAYDPVD